MAALHSFRLYVLVCSCLDVVLACPAPCECSNDPTYLGVLTNCAFRGLTEVPGNIPNTTSTLRLQFNRLKYLKNFTFADLNNAKYLNLNSNKIIYLEENAFVGLSNLEILDLSRNCLEKAKDYPDRVFSSLTHLQELFLNENDHKLACILSELEKNDLSNRSMAMSTELNPDDKFPTILQNGNIENKRYNHFHNENFKYKNYQDNAFLPAYNRKCSYKVLQLPTRAVKKDLSGEEQFPDKALSRAINLRTLCLTGTGEITFGLGFKSLTKLTFLVLFGSSIYIRNTTFVNVPHIETLVLVSKPIKYIEADSFSPLVNLSILSMFQSSLQLDHFVNAIYGLVNTKLLELYISSVFEQLRKIILTLDHLRHFKNLTSLQTVFAANNRIVEFEEGVLCRCIPKSLREVYLEQNMLVFRSFYLDELSCLESLEFLSIEDTALAPSMFFDYYNNDKQTIFNQTKRRVGDYALPPRLKVLKARGVGVRAPLSFDSWFYRFNNLQVIYAGNNYFPTWSSLRGLYRIRELYLDDVFCSSTGGMMQSLQGLEVFDASGNSLKTEINAQFFTNNENLRKLYLSRNDIDVLRKETFLYLRKLEVLDLSANRLSTFQANILHMDNITLLNVSNNQLNALPGDVRAHLDKVSEMKNVTVDMTLNPIACVCENINFLRWMRDSKVQFGGHENYICHQSEVWYQNGENIFTALARLERECKNYAGIFFGAFVSCLTLLIVFCMALAYRFRWKLRYLYYATRLNFRRQNLVEERHFDYDVFVSFDSEDTDFVMGEMKTHLEDIHGLSLCIHIRDFTPGQYIASNILEAIQNSRRTMVVLTRALLESDWCNYELQMAQMEGAHSGRDVLLFLLYEDIPKHELSRDILFNIQSHTYIEFPSTEDDREPFWNRVADALRR